MLIVVAVGGAVVEIWLGMAVPHVHMLTTEEIWQRSELGRNQKVWKKREAEAGVSRFAESLA